MPRLACDETVSEEEEEEEVADEEGGGEEMETEHWPARHCAACRAAGHGDGACVMLCAGLHALFDGKADVVDTVSTDAVDVQDVEPELPGPSCVCQCDAAPATPLTSFRMYVYY